MRFLVPITALTGLLGLAAARIERFGVPKTIKPGDKFDAILMNYNYIQSVDEIAAAFGVAPGEGYPDSLGAVIHSVYLGPDHSDEVANYTFPVTVPETTEPGKATFSTALFQLYGAADVPTAGMHSVPITLGDKTSEEYIYS